MHSACLSWLAGRYKLVDSSNKHLERVIAALVFVIIALVAVMIHLAFGGRPEAAAASSQATPVPQVSLTPPTAPPPAPVLSAPSITPAGVSAPSVNNAAVLLTENDMAGRTATELRQRGNEIYARHGYRFHKPGILAYFSGKSWYHPDTDDMQVAESRFSATDAANLALLHRHEKEIEAQGQEAVKPSRLFASSPTSSLGRSVGSASYIPTPAEMNAIANRATASVPSYNPPPTQSSPLADTPSPSPAADSVQVWVNTKTGIYHIPGSRWYGGTQNGRYMSEPDALAAGYRRSERG